MAASPSSDAIIGRVAVKILPDTSEFRSAAQRDLDALEKALHIEVDLGADTGKLVAEVKAAAEEAQRAVKEIKLRVDVEDTDSIKQAIKRINRELQKLREVEIGVELNEDELLAARAMLEEALGDQTVDIRVNRNSMSSIQKAINAIDGELDKLGEIELQIDMDAQSLIETKEALQRELDIDIALQVNADRDSATKLRREIEDALSGIVVRPDLDDREVRKAMREIESLMEQINDLTATITPELNDIEKRRVEREIEDLRDRIDDLQADISVDLNEVGTREAQARLAWLSRTRIVNLIPKVDSKAAVVAGSVLAALSGGRAIADIFRSLWDSIKNIDKALPKITLLTFGILQLIGYLGTAVSNVLAFGYSMAQLSGILLAAPGVLAGVTIALGFTVYAFTQATNAVKALGKEFVNLLDVGVKEFWEEAEKPLIRMTDKLFPELEKAFKGLGSSLGGAWGELFDQIGTQFQGKLLPMFENLSRSIDIGRKGLADWVSSVVILGTEGSEFLPRLSKWFNKIGADFNDWLTKISKSGQLKEWINAGLQALSELGRVLTGVFRIFAGLATAAKAAGGSTFGILADTLHRVADAINQPAFQKGLTAFFEGAHKGVELLTKFAGPALEKFFATLFKLLGNQLPLVGKTIGKVLGGIADALSQPAVVNGVKSLLSGLSKGLIALTPALKPLGKAIGAIGKPLGALAQQLGKSLRVAVEAIADALADLLPRLTPVIKILGKGLRTILEALAPLLRKFAESWAEYLKMITPKLGQVVKALADGLASLIPSLEPLIPLFFKLGKQIMPLVADIFLMLAKHVFPEAIKILDAMVPVIKDVVQGVIIFVKAIRAIMEGDWEKVWKLVKKQVKNACDFINVTLRNLRETVIRVVMNGIKKIISAAWEWIKEQAKKVWEAIKEYIANKLTQLKERIIAIWDGIRDWLSDKWEQIKQKASEIWNAIKEKVTELMGKLVDAVRDRIERVKEFFTNLPGKIVNAFGNAKDILFDIGVKIVQGLLDGINSLIDKVEEKLQWVTDKIPDWKGPADKDGKLLYRAGQLIMEGLIKGLDKGTDSLREKLRAITQAIPKGANDALVKAIQSGKDRLLNLLHDYDTAARRVENASARLKALQQESRDYAASIRDNINATGDVTSFEDQSFTGIVAGLTTARDKARDFAKTLKQLVKAGLDKRAIDQLAQAGPDAGLAAAQAILDSGKAGIKQINRLQAQIAAAAQAAGGVAADSMYQNGIDMAKGLLEGLESVRGKIVQKMRNIAREMVKAIKDELKIKSPSRVFRSIGRNVGDGFILGLDSKSDAVRKALLLGLDDRKSISTRLTRDLAPSVGAQSQRVLNYYAAPGSSLGSEEDLFAAAGRARMVGW